MFSNHEKEIDLIVSNINQLQSIEQGLITQLSGASDLTTKNKLTNEINAIVQARITLYESLILLYSSMEKNIEESNSQLTKQVSLINEMEEQLNNVKHTNNNKEQTKRVRLIEINKYYIQKYQAYVYLFKMLIKFCSTIIILAIINKINFMPNYAFNVFIGVAFLYWGYYLIPVMFDLFRRDNMNFSHYSWNYIPGL
jgi:hypothetical protein